MLEAVKVTWARTQKDGIQDFLEVGVLGRSAISCLTEKVQQQVTFVETQDASRERADAMSRFDDRQEEISLIPINDPAVEEHTKVALVAMVVVGKPFFIFAYCGLVGNPH